MSRSCSQVAREGARGLNKPNPRLPACRNVSGTLIREHPRVQHRPPASRSLARQRRWPWVVAIAGLALSVVANVAVPNPLNDLSFTVLFFAIVVSFVTVGALLSVRVPANPIGPLILGSGAMLATTVALGAWSAADAGHGDVPVELLALASLANDLGFTIPIVIVLVGIPLIFPDGHLVSPRWRAVVALVVVAVTASGLSQLFGPTSIGVAETPNPFYVPALEPVMRVFEGFASWMSIVAFGAAVLAVVIRYRGGDIVLRQQLKWLAAVASVGAVALPYGYIAPQSRLTDVAFFVGNVAFLALPIAVAIAVLRYRLYEIDRIISRTIGWAVITSVLLGAFAVLVVGLQALLAGQTQGQTLAVAASTLAAFAMFQPVRRRVQAAVDRRFDRARYDAQRTAGGFAERLRSEVAMDAVIGDLEATVGLAMRPATQTLWLRRTR